MTAPWVDASPQLPRVPRRLIAGTGLLAAAVVLLDETAASSAQPTRDVVWGGLSLAAYCFGLLHLIGARQGTGLGLPQWRIGPWALLWCGATSGLATLTFIQPQTGTAAQIALSSVLRALWLVAVGTTMWALGYAIGPGRLVRSAAARGVSAMSRRCASEVRSPAAPWILYAIGSAARLAAAATTGRFGYVGDAASAVNTATGYQQILSMLGLCAPLAVAAAATQVFRERRRGAGITLTVLFLTELAAGAGSANKQTFVVTVLAVAIPYSAARHRLPKSALVIFVFTFLLVIIPFTGAYRSAARGGPATLTSAQAVAAAPGIFRQTVTVHNVLAVLPGSVDYLLQRVREIDSPAIIVQRTPKQISFSSPADLVQAPLLAVVPRAIWPGKPIMLSGYQLNQEYFGLPATAYTSAAVTPVGDLYRHGGWVPVAVGMVVLGCGIRLLDDVLDVRSNPQAIFLLLLLLPDLVKGEDDWVSLLASMPTTVLLWVFAVFLTFRPRRPT